MEFPPRRAIVFLAAVACALLPLSPAVLHAGVSLGVNRVLTVAAVGTPEENCLSLQSTLVEVAGLASSSAPYVVVLEPGLYQCPLDVTLQIGPWFTVEGYGDVTRLEGCSTSSSGTFIVMRHDSALRSVEVVGTCLSNTGSTVISVDGNILQHASNVQLVDVVVNAEGDLNHTLRTELAGLEVRNSRIHGLMPFDLDANSDVEFWFSYLANRPMTADLLCIMTYANGVILDLDCTLP